MYVYKKYAVFFSLVLGIISKIIKKSFTSNNDIFKNLHKLKDNNNKLKNLFIRDFKCQSLFSI